MFHRFFPFQFIGTELSGFTSSQPMPSRTCRDERKHGLSAKYPYFRVIKATKGVIWNGKIKILARFFRLQ